jgi:ABC-type uncharacterized transport system involved in gliding motility auxiliary subunit
VTNIDDVLEYRAPIWGALSKFNLDTELDTQNYFGIAAIFTESPYSLEELFKISKEEVFPVLKYNLLSSAGKWAGFQN